MGGDEFRDTEIGALSGADGDVVALDMETGRTAESAMGFRVERDRQAAAGGGIPARRRSAMSRRVRAGSVLRSCR